MIKRKTLVMISVVMAVILISTAVLAAGCAAPKETGPIKIGTPMSVTGWYAVDQESWYEGMVLAIDEINAAGGLLGRQIELVVFDIENQEAEKIIAAAEKLIGQDKVDMLSTCYAGFGPDIEYFGRYDVPYLHASSTKNTTDMVAADPSLNNVFMVDGHQTEWAIPHARQFALLDYDYPNKKVASLYADDAWSIVYGPALADNLVKQGFEVVMDEQVAYGTREWGPLLAKLRPLEPAIIALEILTAEEGVTFIQQFLENPTDSLIWLGYAGVIPEYPALLGDDVNGIMSGSYGFPMRNEIGDSYRAAYVQKFNKEVPMNIAAGGYDSVYLWAKAVEEVGDPSDHVAVNDALRQITYEGVLGWYSFRLPDQYVAYGAYEDGLLPISMVQYQNGKVVQLFSQYTPETPFQVPPYIK